MIPPDVPSFADWTTYRLERLQLEYESDLRSLRVLRRKPDPETLLYEKWLAAITQELDKRYTKTA